MNKFIKITAIHMNDAYYDAVEQLDLFSLVFKVDKEVPSSIHGYVGLHVAEILTGEKYIFNAVQYKVVNHE